MRDEILRELVEQAEHYGEELLAAGFTVLAKDMEEYLAEHPRNDFLLFRAVYCDVMRDEKEYWGGTDHNCSNRRSGLDCPQASQRPQLKVSWIWLPWVIGPFITSGRGTLEKDCSSAS